MKSSCVILLSPYRINFEAVAENGLRDNCVFLYMWLRCTYSPMLHPYPYA